MLWTTVPTAYANKCKLFNLPEVIQESQEPERYSLLLKWDRLPQAILQNGGHAQSQRLREYKASVREKISIDPNTLLERFKSRAQRQEDLYNLLAVLNDGVGTIDPISCLDSLLLEFQISRNPRMESHPTEFLAMILRKDKLVRVYLLTSDSEGVRGLGDLTELVTTDKKNGWSVEYNLHNHSFFLDDLEGIHPQGVLAPSGTDIGAFVDQSDFLGLPFARITNGFHTLTIAKDEFSLFRGSGT